MIKFSESDRFKAATALEWIKDNLPRGKLPPVPAVETLAGVHKVLGYRLVRKIESTGSKVTMHSLRAVMKNRVCAVCGDKICHSNGFECKDCWGSLDADQKRKLRAEAIQKGFFAVHGRTNIFSGPEGAKMVRDRTYEKYGVTNVMGVEEFRRKSSEWHSDEEKSAGAHRKQVETTLSRYGVTHWTKSERLKKAFRKRMVERTGVDNVMKIPEVKKRWREEFDKIDHQEKYQKASRILYERTGLTNAFLDVENIKKKRLEKTGCIGPWGKETKRRYREKTGFDYPFQNPEILEKALAKARSSSLKRETKDTDTAKVLGNTRSVLGYEPIVINDISRSKSVESIAVGSRVTGVPYVDGNRENRTYHPDLVVTTSSGDWIVEVKSTYTLASGLDKNLRKFRAARRVSGDRFILAVVFREDIFYIRNFSRLATRIRAKGGRVLREDLHRCAYKTSSSVSTTQNAGTKTTTPSRSTRTSSVGA